MEKSRSRIPRALALAALGVALSLGLCACAAAFAQEGGGAQGGTPQGQLAADGASFLEAQDSEVVETGTWGTCPWERTADGTLYIHPGTTDYYGQPPWNWNVTRVVFLAENGNYVRPASCYQLFCNDSNLTSVDLSGLDISGETTMREMFKDCSSLTSVDLSGLDTSSVQYMNGLFDGCSSLTTLNLSGLDTSKVVEMSSMFSGCSNLTSLNLSGLDTSKVTSMYSMFSGCKSLTSLDFSGFDTSHVTNMSFMFSSCSGLTSLNLSGFNTSSVTNMYYMLSSCSSLTSLNLSGFDTSHVTNMSYMFDDCSALTSLDLSGFDASSATDTSFMFQNCSSLVSLNLSGFGGSSVTDMDRMFLDCSSLVTLNLSGFETSSVTDMYSMFSGCSALTSLDLSGFNTSSVKDMTRMFKGCSALTSLDLSRFDTSSVTVKYNMYGGYGMTSMFEGCSSLTSLDLSGFDTSSVTGMSSMFKDCSSLTSVNLTGLDVSSVELMGSMFSGCSALTSLDLSGFDTSSVRGMSSMFSGCSALTSLNISGFNTTSVTNMTSMFENCTSLTSLDLSSFDTSSVTLMNSMFEGCSKLETIYATDGFVCNSDCRAYEMFDGCVCLVGGNGTRYPYGSARIDEPPDAPGYFTYGSLVIKTDRTVRITFDAGDEDGTYNIPMPVKFGPSLFNKSSDEYRRDLARLSILLCEVAGSEKIDRGRLKCTVTDGSRGSGLVLAKVSGKVGRDQRTDVTEYDAQAKSESYIYNAFKSMGGSSVDVRSYYYEDNMYSWRRGKYPDGNENEGGYGVAAYAIGRVKMEIAGEVDDVVVVMLRGTPDNGEWNSNFNVANSGFGQDYHQGFSEAEEQVMDSLEEYCADKQLDPAHTKILITGHSRGAAVANMLAGRLNRMSHDGEGLASREDIYAYTFASPRGIYNQALHSGDYAGLHRNIFNIINPEDFVTRMPLNAWGYYRFGTSKVLPSRSNMPVKEYKAAYAKFYNKYYYFFGDQYKPYKDGTAPVDKLVENCESIAPNVREYYEHNRKLKLILSTAHTPYDYFQALATFLADKKFSNLKWLDVLSNSISEYVSISKFFATNLDRVLAAHMQHTYFSWMFSDLSDEELFGQSSDDAGTLSLSAQEDGDEPAVDEVLFGGAYRVQRFYDCENLRVYDSAGDLVCRVEGGEVDEGVMENGLAAGIGNHGEVVVYLPCGDSYAFEVDGESGARMSVESYDETAELVSRSVASGLSEDGAYTGAVAEGEGAGGVTLQAPHGSEVGLVAAAEGEEAGFVVEIETEGAGTAWTAGPAHEGEPITAYAEPVGGGEFLGWYDAEGELVGSEAEYTFEAHEGALLTAKFTEVAFTPTWARVSGSTRYATMAAIAEEAFPGGCETAVLVNGTDKNFPDALSAAALAGAWDCPIVTTAPGSLRAEARAQLERLGVERVFIVGGTGAVSEAVADEVSWLNGGVEVERVYGSTRYKTSTAVMRAAAEYRRSDTVFVATGTNFPDALAAGPISYAFDSPILLVNPAKGLTADQLDALQEYGAPNAVILGGTKAVPEYVEEQLAGVECVESVSRLAGSTRYETATELADLAASWGATAERPVVATALSPADALAGAPLAGRNGSVVLLTSEKKGGDLAVEYLADRSGELERGVFLGGEKAIPGGLAQKYLDATGATME